MSDKASLVVSRLLIALLGKRRRRIVLLHRWNTFSCPCAKTNGLEQVLHTLITTFLYQPLCLELTHDALFPWGTAQAGLSIPFDWMSQPERDAVKFIHAHRRDLFRHERRMPRDESKFCLTNYMPALELCLQHRRELVRDLVGLCSVPVQRIGLDADKNGALQIALRYALVVTVQRLLHGPGRVDAFLMPLVRYLSGACAFEHVMVMDLTGESNVGVVYE